MDKLPPYISTNVVRHRLPLVVIAHLLLIPLSNYLAFWLRFDGDIPVRTASLMWQLLPLLILIRAAMFMTHRLYKGLWRYTGLWDLWRIVSATFIGTLIFFLVGYLFLEFKAYPRSVFVIDSILQIGFLSGIRLPWRIYRELKRTSHKGKRVIIYGAGDAGEMIVRDMKVHPDYNYNPVGFIDDNRGKAGQSIHGVPVLGMRDSLPKILQEHQIDELIVAIPTAEGPILRDILKKLEPFDIPIKTTPNFRDILDGRVTLNQIRNLAVEDLLTRVPINLDLTPVSTMLRDKRVLITGAGGSIGSELCRQVLDMNIIEVLLFDRNENGLYEIVKELERLGHKNRIRPMIGDITDRHRIDEVFSKYEPHIVFHAAAHKHVPMMEGNVCEAIKNNIGGTRLLAEAAIEYGVQKFVMISTDKAVNPTSIMGASKRVAEMITNHLSTNGKTNFVAVRFGNVLASQGSVVPLFQEQIRRGGPVTVTHPDMKRYFMLIPEAVQLVLLAGALRGGSTYVLQMGEQILVLEMARNLIRLSGFIPDVEIPIIFTDVRPGEKLYEELVAEDEIAEPSSIPEILRIKQRQQIDSNTLKETVRALEAASRAGHQDKVLACLRKLIPTFRAGVEQIRIPESSIESRIGA